MLIPGWIPPTNKSCSPSALCPRRFALLQLPVEPKAVPLRAVRLRQNAKALLTSKDGRRSEVFDLMTTSPNRRAIGYRYSCR